MIGNEFTYYLKLCLKPEISLTSKCSPTTSQGEHLIKLQVFPTNTTRTTIYVQVVTLTDRLWMVALYANSGNEQMIPNAILAVQ